MKTIAKTNIRNALYGLTAGLLLLAAGASTASANPASPIDNWPFDEAGGSTAFNLVAGRPNGTLSAGASFVPGQSGNAVRLPSYESVDFGATTGNVGTSDFTISFLIKTVGEGTTSSYAGTVLGNRGAAGSRFNGIGFRMRRNGQLQYAVDNETGSAYALIDLQGPAINDGEWHQVVATREGPLISLYIDCALVGTDSTRDGTTLNVQSPYHFIAGANQNAFTYGLPFNGFIDALQIHDCVVPPVCSQDNLLTPTHEAQLETWLGQGNVTLTKIFSKEPGDNKDAPDFHAAVDHEGPTFTVISIYGNGGGTYGSIPDLDAQIIGGYNPQSWDDSLGGYTITPALADRTAFLFNLTSGNLVPQNDTAEGRHQVFNLPWYGPTFGSGHDLVVGNNPYKLERGSGRNHYSYGDGSDGQSLFMGVSNLTFWGHKVFVYSVAKLEVYSISLNTPPTAAAGVDFSVNEGQLAVALDGSGSSDPDNDPLTYAWVQVGGTTVVLTDATTVNPTFPAPVVALGGETLSFELTVTANGETSTATVSVTVVNVNHPPVADAGIDQTLANASAVAEGSPVTLHGEDSFDIDNDVIDFVWTQVSGPAVTLTGANTANPTFDAPYFETGGAPGVVATLVFELLVDDGYGGSATDNVVIEITNTNNLPVASAGSDQTVDENTAVTLDAGLSSDPDTDALTYAWTQVAGPAVVLDDATSASPSFTAPFVNAGGADFEFQLSVDDGYGGSATDNVVIHVQNANDPPNASLAQPTIGLLWPPNHALVAVGITGVSDPDNNATIVITSVTQDEPTNGLGDGDTAIDAIIDGDAVLLRAERSGKGDGRVYHVHFTASDLEGSSSGVVKVTVPHSKKKAAVDGGELFNSAE